MAVYERKNIIGKKLPNGNYELSPMDIKHINDTNRMIFLKVFGNIDTADLTDGAVTKSKLSSPVVIDIEQALKDGEYSRTQVDIQAGQISALVTQKVSNSTFNSYVAQTANEISSKVSKTDYDGYTIASLINQTYKSIDISAIDINLNGYVTFTDLEHSGYTTIHGSNIMTGTISLDRIKPASGDVIKFGGGGEIDNAGASMRLKRSSSDYILITSNSFGVYIDDELIFGVSPSAIHHNGKELAYA